MSDDVEGSGVLVREIPLYTHSMPAGIRDCAFWSEINNMNTRSIVQPANWATSRSSTVNGSDCFGIWDQ